MPDLGKATYVLTLSTVQANAAFDRFEVKANQTATSVSTSMGRTKAAVASMGATVNATADKVVASEGRIAAASERTGKIMEKSAERGRRSIERMWESGKKLGEFLIGGSLIVGLYESFRKADELAASMRQLRAQLDANGESFAAVQPYVLGLRTKMERLGFTQADTAEGFARLDRAGRSAAIAYRYIGLAANLAAIRHISLANASLLIGKIIQGNTQALNRFGIIVPRALTPVQALAFVEKKLAGQAEAATTAHERFRATLTDFFTTVGNQLLPVVDHYIERATSWIEVSANQQKIINSVKGGVVAFAQALRIAVAVIGQVIGAVKTASMILGGFKHLLLLIVGIKVTTFLFEIAVYMRNVAVSASAAEGGILGFRAALVGTIPIIGAGVAAYLALQAAINAARSAQDAEAESIGRTGTDRGARLAYYAARTKYYERQGLKPQQARAKAQADTNKHLGKTFGTDTSATSGLPPGTLKLPPLPNPKVVTGNGLIPVNLQIQEIQAGLTKSDADDKRVLGLEMSFLRTKLGKAKAGSAAALAIWQEIGSVDSKLRAIISAEASKAKSKTKGLSPFGAGFDKLQIELAKAQRTASLKDDVKTLTAEETYLKNLLKNKKLSLAKQEAIQKELTRVDKARVAAVKKMQQDKLNSLKEIQAAMDLRGTFFGQFAGNVFSGATGALSVGSQSLGSVLAPQATSGIGTAVHKNLTYEQNNTFHEIPKDRHALARQMKSAATAAMD